VSKGKEGVKMQREGESKRERRKFQWGRMGAEMNKWEKDKRK
jgi:hypothetical protein